eukprot:gb/GECG01015042.1/.p1 GENE.gb/GECG01015042.1/~~gb/GECG01015042.1/.p1  ORF type:complete len:401 (+),score=38.40 gb/GECG01015042.1/:1-1203(+)
MANADRDGGAATSTVDGRSAVPNETYSCPSWCRAGVIGPILLPILVCVVVLVDSTVFYLDRSVEWRLPTLANASSPQRRIINTSLEGVRIPLEDTKSRNISHRDEAGQQQPRHPQGLVGTVSSLGNTKAHQSGSGESNPVDTCKRKIMYFLHVHKAGGTTLCKLASQNGLRTAKKNCNVFVSHKVPCCGKTIAEQRKFAATTEYDLVANEKYMPDELDYGCFQYVTVLRDPRDRYVSHYLFARDVFFGEKRMGKFADWVTHQPDNYLLRVICGESCKSIPRGQLNHTHLEFAKERLERFSAVLILENLDDGLAIMQRRFGWKTGTAKPINRGKSPDKGELQQTARRKEFSDLVTWDMELYAYGRYLSERQVQESSTRQQYVAKNAKCTSSCCSPKCSQFR